MKKIALKKIKQKGPLCFQYLTISPLATTILKVKNFEANRSKNLTIYPFYKAIHPFEK